MIPKRSQINLKLVPNKLQHGTKLILKLSQTGPKESPHGALGMLARGTYRTAASKTMFPCRREQRKQFTVFPLAQEHRLRGWGRGRVP